VGSNNAHERPVHLDPGVTTWRGLCGPAGDLPEWYLPVAAGVRHRRSSRMVVTAEVADSLFVDALVLCVTSVVLPLPGSVQCGMVDSSNDCEGCVRDSISVT
jgi:hypothetical protein